VAAPRVAAAAKAGPVFGRAREKFVAQDADELPRREGIDAGADAGRLLGEPQAKSAPAEEQEQQQYA
jgi:hypothetical protein